LILAVSTAAGLLHQFAKIKPVGVDALCPFGGIESFYTFITQGVMVKRIVASSFILLIAILIAAVLFRRTFCGNICSLGTLQEINNTRNKLRGILLIKNISE
jgi:polyferredoxin